MNRVVPCAGAVVLDACARLLLVRRGRPPEVGSWTVPGGRVEAGESARAAVAREVREETGLDVEVGRLLGTVRRAGPAGQVYEISDFACTPTGGELRAGDDAADARWFALDELPAPLTTGLLETLDGWEALPR